jgi:hypothetical protein
MKTSKSGGAVQFREFFVKAIHQLVHQWDAYLTANGTYF